VVPMEEFEFMPVALVEELQQVELQVQQEVIPQVPVATLHSVLNFQQSSL